MIDESPIDNKLRLRSSANRGLSWSDLDQIYREMTDMEFCYDIPNSFYIITYDQWWKANSELYYPTIFPPTKLYYSNDGGNNLDELIFTDIGSVLDTIPILSLTVHPYDSSKLWITLGGFVAYRKVYYSDDGGDNWSNITGFGLPNLPIQCIEYDFLNDYLYVGTDVGIFYKSLSSTLWVAADGIPKTIITDIELNKGCGDLVVGTYGRGIYRTNLGEGYCKTTGNPIIIENSVTWSTDSEYCEYIIVPEDGHLTISGKATMSFESTITVEEDGILKIDGGEIINGNIIVEDGGILQLVDNGKIFQNYEDELSIESGGILDILEGEIENVEQ